MIARGITIKDMEELYDLHRRFFPEFDPPPFADIDVIDAFVIENENKIVMGGLVRKIAETIIVTDKEANPHTLGEALLLAQNHSLEICRQEEIELLHAFVKDENYKKHLLKHGFSPRCSALYMSV